MSDDLKIERLTISLGKGQKRQLKALAAQRRTSLATVIRWALDEFVASNASGSRLAKSKDARTKVR